MRALLLVLAALAASPAFAQTLPLTIPECNCDGVGGAGTISAVGDVASGAAFDGTAGTVLTFNDADGDQTLTYDTTNNRFVVSDDVRFPASAGSSASVRVGTSDTGIKDATGSGQFTIRSNGTDVMDFIGTGWRLLTASNLWFSAAGDVGSQIGNRFNFGGGNGLRIYGEGASGTEQFVGMAQGDFTAHSRGLGAYLPVAVTTATSGAPRAVADAEVGYFFTNTGATAQTYVALHAAAAGFNNSFLNVDSDGLRVVAAAGDTITVGTALGPMSSTSGGYCETTAVGALLSLVAISDADWYAENSTGVWTCS